MRKRHVLLILGCLLLPLRPAAADYRVDLIVTLNRNASPDVVQTLGSAVQPPAVRAAIDIDDRPGLQRAGIRLLPDGQFGLDSEWRKLRNSRFRPVLRLAWHVAPRPTATAVRFHDTLRYQLHSTIDLATGKPVGTPSFELHRLDGTLLVQQSAGLRVSLNLNYTLPVNAPPADYPSSSSSIAISTAELATLNLKAEKRVNLGQTHFFDHPLLGVLLRVSPAN